MTGSRSPSTPTTRPTTSCRSWGTAEVTEIQGVVAEYAQAAVRYLGWERGEAYVGSLPSDLQMGRIAVRPDQVVVLHFETRFPSPVTSLQRA